MSADDEDDLDAFALRDEDPRTGLGYDNEPRLRRRPSGAPTRWAFVDVEIKPGEQPGGGPIGGEKRCRDKALGGCGEPASILHAIGDDPRRLYCGKCQGAANRARIGWAQAGEPEPDRGRR